MPCAHLTDSPLVVAVDSSTQSTKAIIVDGAGNVLSLAKRKIELLTPAMNHYEHDPRQWWQTTYETIGQALAALTPTQRQRVKAIGLTHQRESFAPFKADGTPIGNGILWLDGRAVDQIERYGSNQIHELSGKPAGVTPALYKLAWVKENQPHLLQNADKVCDVLCYLVDRVFVTRGLLKQCLYAANCGLPLGKPQLLGNLKAPFRLVGRLRSLLGRRGQGRLAPPPGQLV